MKLLQISAVIGVSSIFETEVFEKTTSEEI